MATPAAEAQHAPGGGGGGLQEGGGSEERGGGDKGKGGHAIEQLAFRGVLRISVDRSCWCMSLVVWGFMEAKHWTIRNKFVSSRSATDRSIDLSRFGRRRHL